MKLYEAGAKFAVFVCAEVAKILTRPGAACQILAPTRGDLRTVPASSVSRTKANTMFSWAGSVIPYPKLSSGVEGRKEMKLRPPYKMPGVQTNFSI
jgi:hypothetical protein